MITSLVKIRRVTEAAGSMLQTATAKMKQSNKKDKNAALTAEWRFL